MNLSTSKRVQQNDIVVVENLEAEDEEYFIGYIDDVNGTAIETALPDIEEPQVVHTEGESENRLYSSLIDKFRRSQFIDWMQVNRSRGGTIQVQGDK